MQPDLNGPLVGKHIVVTRPQEDAPVEAESFESRLSAWGARVSRIPLVEVGLMLVTWQPDRSYDWIFFTSKNAVRAFYQSALPASPVLKDAQIAVVGPATAEVVASHGGRVDFVSPQYNAESAAQAFCQTIEAGGLSVLWPCGNLANQRLLQMLTHAGAAVMPLTVYETRLRDALSLTELACFETSVDLLVFTSPSAVEAFAGLQQALAQVRASTANALISCLGPKTVQTAIQRLGRSEIQPESSTLEALAQAIYQFYSELEGKR